MDNAQDSKTTPHLLESIGLVLLASGGQAMLTTEGYKTAATLTVVFGLIFFCGGLFWNRLKPRLGVHFTASMGRVASDFRSWLILVSAVWLWMVGTHVLTEIRRTNEIVSLRNDVQSIANVLQRHVLPRRLSKGRIAQMGRSLAMFEPHEVTFEVIPRDEEASNFRANLQQAFERGGWKVIAVKAVDNLPEGLSIHVQQLRQSPQAKEDLKDPRFDKILQIAFGLSGVQIDGGLSIASGPPVTAESVTIRIGRRKSNFVTPQDPDESD
jgi:hypothetical protein